MSHGERPTPRVVQGRTFGTADGAVVLDGTERGDTAVTVRLQHGQAPTDEAAQLDAVALRALVADVRERLDVLEAFAPEGVR